MMTHIACAIGKNAELLLEGERYLVKDVNHPVKTSRGFPVKFTLAGKVDGKTIVRKIDALAEVKVAGCFVGSVGKPVTRRVADVYAQIVRRYVRRGGLYPDTFSSVLVPDCVRLKEPPRASPPHKA